MELREMILQAMRASGKPLTAGNIADLTGIDRKMVNQVLALMKRNKEIVSPSRSRWEPADK